LYDKVCVLTGKLEYMTRKEAMQTIADIGGINANGVTKKTNYLILGNFDYSTNVKGNKSAKLRKAEKYILEGQDLQILSENVFYDLISIKI
ncbi:BRCT domain-containing protein, partial [Staphylococcus simulans]